MTTAKLRNSTAKLHTDRHLIAGRYCTHARIGHGRLGEIFAATDESYEDLGVEQHVAIQIFPQSVVQNNSLFNKINVGYTVLRASAHPNTVNILHSGRDAKFAFLVTELLDGASLRLVLDDAEKLPLHEAKPVICGVGEALRFLHAKNMVHGNLTTGNVFITDDLEVRLLDVVPLNAAEAIFRGTAMSEPFSHCTVEDDVFGLACLAYEMLSGRHPFNYSSPGEAKLARLEADGIDALTENEWNALRGALSFDRAERTSSVADFMHGFGIAGTERLRPAEDQSEGREAVAYPAAEEAPPMSRIAVPVKGTAAAAPIAAVSSVSRNHKWQPVARPNHKKTRPLRAVFLGTLLAGLSAWSYYGQPAEQLANAIAYVDETLDLGLTVSGDGFVDAWTTDPGIPKVDSPVTEPAASIETSLTETEESISESEPASTVQENVSAAEETIDQPPPAESLTVENATDAFDEIANGQADEISAGTDAVSTQAKTNMFVVAPFVSVSERDGAVRIALQLNTNSTAQLTWWTSADTAIADQDFIAVQQRIMTGAMLEDGNILHVPLINDGVPEPTESFYVHLGLRNADHGRIEPVTTVRVNIIDDDPR